ncbi:MAG: hypothetical protein ACRDBG_28320 [Waterburya sp.]
MNIKDIQTHIKTELKLKNPPKQADVASAIEKLGITIDEITSDQLASVVESIRVTLAGSGGLAKVNKPELGFPARQELQQQEFDEVEGNDVSERVEVLASHLLQDTFEETEAIRDEYAKKLFEPASQRRLASTGADIQKLRLAAVKFAAYNQFRGIPDPFTRS